MKCITSTENPNVKMWRTLLQSRGIKRNKRAIVSGARIVKDILKYHPKIIETYLTSKSCGDIPKNLPDRVEQFLLDDQLFRELDIFGTRYPLLIVSIKEPLLFKPDEIETPMTLIVPFQDPSNVGAVIRSAVAFGVRDIVLTSEAASPYHPKSIRASGGYVFAASFRNGPELRAMPELDMPVFGLSSDGTPITEIEFPSPCALVTGIEGPGLPALPWITRHVAIPMSPDIESLNAAVATSIALYEWKKGNDRK